MRNSTTLLLLCVLLLLVVLLGLLVHQHANFKSIERALAIQGEKISILYKIADRELDLGSYGAALEEKTKDEDMELALELVGEYRNPQYTCRAGFHPRKPVFAVLQTTGTVLLIDTVERREGLVLRQAGEIFSAFAFFPDGDRMVLGTETGRLYQANLETGEIVLLTAFDSGREVARLVAGGAGKIAVGLGGDPEQGKQQHSGFVYDADTRNMLALCEASFRDDFQGIAISSTGNVVAINEVDGKPRGPCLFRSSDAAQISLLYDSRYPSGPLSVAIGSDDTTIAVGYAPSDVIVWNAGDGTIRWLFDGHTNWVTSLAFSKDMRHLASGAGDSSARVYDLHTGKEVGRVRFPGESTYVNSVDISSDGSLLLAAIDGYTGVYKLPQ